MKKLIAFLALSAAAACGDVDDAPLGGPYGGTTDPTDPNTQTIPPDDDSGTTPPPGDDSGTKPPPQQDSGTPTKDAAAPKDSGGSTAPTWTAIFNAYLAGSKEGRCSQCHSQGSSASNLYTWLAGKGYISGTKSALVSSSQSCLSWYGGNMPPSGPGDAKAVSDMNAWAAAGAANN